jgi:hypothetical protein
VGNLLRIIKKRHGMEELIEDGRFEKEERK